MKTINLEEILLSKIPKECYWEEMGNLTNCPKKYIIEAMEEFGKQLLYLASENAKTTEISIENWEEIDYESDFNYIPLMNEWEEIEGLNKIIINKPSILDTINQVK